MTAMTHDIPGSTRLIPETTVFNLDKSHQGYDLNKMCDSLRSPANRMAYKRDEDAYLSRFGMNEHVKSLVKARDWAGLVDAGGNIYFLIKLGFVVGHGLYHMGAQMRGESFEAFLATRDGKGAR